MVNLHSNKKRRSSMITLQEPHQTRPIRFLELWQEAGWRVKVYGIAYQRPVPRLELIEAVKRAAPPHLIEGPTPLASNLLNILDSLPQ